MKNYSKVADYLRAQSGVHLKFAKEMRKIIKSAIPKTTECISYGMPAYRIINEKEHVVVYFAAMKGHLGFYPTPDGVNAFADRLGAYSTSKGCIRFRYDGALPKKLISDICKYRYKSEL